MTMDNDSDTFGVGMPQKILQKISQDDYAAIDYPFSMASNNSSSSDFVEVRMDKLIDFCTCHWNHEIKY